MRVERQLWFWAAALVVVVSAIALLRDILLPFVAAVVIGYFLNPVADRLEAYGVKRPWAATLIVGVVAVLVLSSGVGSGFNDEETVAVLAMFD